MTVSTTQYARGKFISVTSTSTAEDVAMIATQGMDAAGGISIIISGSGAGTVKLYFVDFNENIILTDEITTGAKIANDLFIINYGGRLPKFAISITPSSSSSQVWDIEAMGVA